MYSYLLSDVKSPEPEELLEPPRSAGARGSLGELLQKPDASLFSCKSFQLGAPPATSLYTRRQM